MVAFIVLIAVVFGAGGVVAWRTHRRDAPPPGSGTGTSETWNNGGGGPTAGMS